MIDKNIYRILLLVVITATVIDGVYLGCYKEGTRKRHFKINPGAIGPGKMSRNNCMTLCGGLRFQFAGLSQGSWCWCSNDTVAGVLDLDSGGTKCNMPCEEGIGTCGSSTHVDVFDTLPPTKLSLGVLQSVVATQSPVTFIPNVQTTALSYKLAFNYDDDAGFTGYEVLGTGLLSRIYYVAGEKAVIAQATSTDEMLEPVQAGINVKVVRPPCNVILTCPTVMATHKQDKCIAEISCGTDMKMDVTFSNGDPSRYFPISDALEHTVGNPVLMNPGTAPTSTIATSGLVLLTMSQAEHDGQLMGFEYHAAYLGTVNFFIYRPNCGGNVYCYDTNNCVSGSCAQNCGGLPYCLDIRACCSGPPARTTTMLATYDRIFSSGPTSVPAVGHNWLPVAVNIQIQPGDIVGLEATNTITAYNTSAVANDYYCAGQTGGPSTISAGSCTTLNEEHQARAVYTSPSKAAIPLLFLLAGQVDINVLVQSRELPIPGTVTHTAQVDVLEGVDRCVLDMPQCIPALLPVQFTLLPFTGTSTITEFDFGNGDIRYGTSWNDMTYTYPAAGTYQTYINISNANSYAACSHTMCVQELITGLVLGNNPTPVFELGVSSSIQVQMATGTDYNCTFKAAYGGYQPYLMTTDYSNTPPGSSLEYTFHYTGPVSLELVCSNMIGAETYITTGMVVQRIANVALKPPGAWPYCFYRIIVAWEEGSNVNVVASFNGVSEPMTIDSEQKQAISETKTAGAPTMHSVSVTVSNQLNSISLTQSFSIEFPIVNCIITCNFLNRIPAAYTDKIAIFIDTDVECTVTMDSGTSVTVSVDYGDGSVDNHSTGLNVAWADNPMGQVTHTFSSEQECTLQVIVTNNVNSYSQTYHVQPVKDVVGVGLVLNSGIASYNPPCTAEFSWTFFDRPNFLSALISFGDGSTTQVENLNLSQPIQHEYYDQTGALTMEWEVFNLRNRLSGTVTVQCMIPVKNASLTTSTAAASPNVPIDLIFMATQAPNAGDCSLTFDCGNGVAPTTRPRAESSPHGQDTESCVYITTGTFYPTVTLISTLETITLGATLSVIHAVTNEFKITGNLPIDYMVDNSCTANILVEFTGPIQPSNAMIKFSYSDGSMDGPFPFSSSHFQTHAYAVPGSYETNITVHNDAGSFEQTIESGCYTPLTNPSVKIKRVPSLPLDAPPTDGFGVNKDVFRVDELILLVLSATGTFGWWDITAVSGGNVVTCNTSHPTQKYLELTEAGDYTVTGYPRNAVYLDNGFFSESITMVKPCKGMSVDDGSLVTRINEMKSFDFFFGTSSTTQCVAVDYGEENFIYTYGDPYTCAQSVTQFPNKPSVYNSTINALGNFSASYVYSTEQEYEMQAFCWTDYSFESTSFYFPVSGVLCFRPIVNIVSRKPDFQVPRECYKSDTIEIVGVVDISCPETLNNIKSWRAFKWDDKNNMQIAEVDLSGLTSKANAKLSIPGNYLECGLYWFVYEVAMLGTGSAEFKSTVGTFVKMKKSPLQVQLWAEGLSGMTVGPDAIVELNPIDFCLDPDVLDGEMDVFDRFDLCCWDSTNGEQPTTASIPIPDPSGPAHNGSSGGCFGHGPGCFKNFDGRMRINTTHMKASHRYQFKVTGYKDERMSSFTGFLEVYNEEPPFAQIQFIQSQITDFHSDGKMFNPSKVLGLKVNVFSNCNFTWELCISDHNYDDTLFQGYRPVLPFGDYVTGLDGIHSQELEIAPDLWLRYTETDFQVRCKVTDLDTGVTGMAVTNLKRNREPHGGDCTISPSTGTTLTTKVRINCSQFEDDDNHEIVEHAIYCDGYSKNMKVCSGTVPEWVDLFLPAGDPNNGYVLECWVEARDRLGAIGKVQLADVVSIMPSPADLRDQLANLQDQLDLTYALADLDQTAGMISAICPALQSISNNDENSDYAGMGIAPAYSPTSFGNDSRMSPFEKPSPDEEAVKAYEADRKKYSSIVHNLVETMGRTTVLSNQDTKAVFETCAKLANVQPFLQKRTQNMMLNLLSTGMNNLLTNKNDLSVDDAESMTSQLTHTCQSLKEATKLNMDHPSENDLDEQDPSQFPTNRDSLIEDVIVTENMTSEEAEDLGQRSLNAYDQKKFSSIVNSKCTALKSKSIRLLNHIKARSTTPMTFSTVRTDTTILISTAAHLGGQSVANRAGSMTFPGDMLSSLSPDTPLTLVAEGATSNPNPAISADLNSFADPFSRSMTASIMNADGEEVKVTNLQDKIGMVIGRDPYRKLDNDSGLPYANPETKRIDEIGFTHSVLVTKDNSSILAKFMFPTNNSIYCQMLVLVAYEEMPELKPSNVIHSCLIPKDTLQTDESCTTDDKSNYACFVPGEKIGTKTGNYLFQVIQLNDNEVNLYQDLNFLPEKERDEWKGMRPFCMNYKFKAIELSCAYSQSGSSVMKTDGMEAEEVCSGECIKCRSSHLTSFAGGWVVAPNTIDWDFVFSNADFFKNPTLYITEIVIVVVYILAMIWARRKDKQDLTMLGLAPLLDNDPRDRYYYEILVNTGMRRNAGTESQVHFILSGEEDETDVRTFTDKKRKIFQRGQTDGFLMAVESTLGALSYLRIWHDNGGKGKMASWYLNHVMVRDVQTDKKYYFIANKWFAVEEDDGQVDRVIPVAGKEQMTEFSYMFTEKATKNLSDGHLWFSVVARPPQSRFTRCQRVSCCLCLLFMSMLANAMFYGTENSDNTAYQFGPFALTPEQIFIGVAANLIIFPVNFLIITLFRKSRPRKLRPSRVEEALKSMPERTTSMTDVNMRVKSSMSTDRPGSSFLIDAKRSESSMARPESSLSAEALKTKSKKKKKCTLPWWFMIVAWILLWVTVLVSAAFVTFYGIMFQDIKCKKWITSMLVSFFTSIFFTQPIKVFLFAIIFSLIIKNPGGEDEEEDDEEPRKALESDEELLHQDDYCLTAPTRPLYKPKPPDQKSLEAARQQRMKEIQMWAVIREILFYAFFLWILMVISYKSVSTDSYHYKYNMEKVFIITKNSSHSFTSIKNVESFWVWAQTQMLRGLRAGPYYNNYPAFNMRGYINDKVSMIMGYAVLRQLRVKPGSCKLPSQVEDVIDECNAPYSYSKEQKGNFGPGWTGAVNYSREEYLYMDADSLDGYPFWGEMAVYSGGGYVIKLNKDYADMVAQLQQLEREKWIDEYTRAVFLEFTVYNPAINMFSISTLLAEFRPSGGVFPWFRFEPVTLLPYMSAVLLFQVICEITYLLFTCYFVIKELRAFYQQRLKYFYQFWNIMDLCICAMSVTAIVIYFYRLVCINELTEYFHETKGAEYMKFQYVGYWSEIFSYIIGFLVYFASLKFLKLLRFNKRVSLLADTLKNSAKDLIHFSIIFNIVFLAFIQVFYLIYVARISTFKTFLSSCEAGIVMMMGKFDIYNMLEVNQWLTQIFLFLFVVTITFIVVNMFLSILNDTFGAVRNNMANQSNDYEIVEFMMSRFKLWTGIGRGSNTTISPADLEKERQKNYNTLEGQIEYFPDQIDRFLASISHMYMEKSKFDDFLHKGAYGKMAMKAQKFGGSSMHPAPKPGATRLSDGARGMTDVHTD